MKDIFYYTHCRLPVGKYMLASDGDSITGLWRAAQKYYGASAPDVPRRNDDLPIFAAAVDWLERYFGGERPAISELPLAPRGGEFRQTVWKLLCEIPYGEVTTYGAIAREIATMRGKKSMSAQAVGGALGHNPISIIIPCHRVVGSDGSLVGYAGGLDIKVRLLKHEGVAFTASKYPLPFSVRRRM